MKPDFSIEKFLGGIVVGVDEVGRGALAGPVISAAAIVLNPEKLKKINDSKKLSKKAREEYELLIKENTIYSIGSASVEEIDSLNILNATLLSMKRAIFSLESRYDNILVDGNASPFPNQENCKTIIKGDSKSISIAAASIIAKVHRDRIMESLGENFKDYGWRENVGYGAKVHLEAIRQLGPTIHHRKQFIRRIITKDSQQSLAF